MTAAMSPGMASTTPEAHRWSFPLFRWRVPMPAYPLAAVVLAALLIVLFAVIPRYQRGPADTSEKTYALHELMRGGETVTLITKSPQTASIHLLLPRLRPGAGTDYRFRVSDARESETFAPVLHPDFSGPDSIRLDLDPRSLPDGRYFLILTAVTRTAPADSSVRRFAFELKTTRQ
jgi:hypothetical protein